MNKNTIKEVTLGSLIIAMGSASMLALSYANQGKEREPTPHYSSQLRPNNQYESSEYETNSEDFLNDKLIQREIELEIQASESDWNPNRYELERERLYRDFNAK